MSRQETVDYLQSPLPDEAVAGITGNASRELKEIPVKWLSVFRKNGKGFAGGISGRMEVADVSILPSRDDSLKMEARVTIEITVMPGAPTKLRTFLISAEQGLDMCNERGVLHEGLIVFLVDEYAPLIAHLVSIFIFALLDALQLPW